MANPKVLFLDLETTPNVVYSWGLWVNGMLSHDNILEERTILSACWSWEGENTIHSAVVDYRHPKNDIYVVQTVIDQINKADAVVAHNGDRFDMRWLYARAIFHKLPPPAPILQIDTKKLAKSRFNFNSNRLDYLAQFFGIGRKIKTEFELWKECIAGSKKALETLVKYNKHDIVLLKGVYACMKAYLPSKINRQLFGSLESCSDCGSHKIQYRGFHYTTAHKYRRFQCTACGHWDHSRKAEK